MSDIHPLTRERHRDRAWNNAAGLGWAGQDRMVAVGWQEATQLMMTLPLGFARQGDQFLLVVLLGLRHGENLMVGEDGTWLGPRVPTALQHYPFRRLRDTEGRDVLGVDERGLLPADAIGGSALYDGNDRPVAELAPILAQLIKGDQDRARARELAATLDQQGLLDPWELKTQDEAGVQKVEGLYRINEGKLNALPAEPLHTLRNAGALVMAYCQILSMQNVHHLGQLAATRQQRLTTLQTAAAKAAANNLIDDQGVISFANL